MGAHAGDALGVLAFLVAIFILVTLGRVGTSDRHPDALWVALAQVGVWAFSRSLDVWLLPPDSKALNPALDLVLFAWISWMWWTRREWWKVAFLGLLFIQVWLSVIYHTNPGDASMLYRYRVGLNLAFLGQLMCVAWPGGVRCVRIIGDYMRRRDHALVRGGAR